jgi:hypothetical protein
MHLEGRARDLRTDLEGRSSVLAEDSMNAVIGTERSIERIEVSPARDGIESLLGARGGGRMRAAIDAALPEDRRNHTPLALLVDDIAGASLIGIFAWSRHRADWLKERRAQATSTGELPVRRSVEGICSGFRPGSSALRPDGTSVGQGQNVARVPSLVDPADPVGWHELPAFAEVGMRRARRMDLWREGDIFHIDAHFRDSCTDPALEEVAIHEYSLEATVDVETLSLTNLRAQARVLPYPECPAAAPNASWLVGQPLAELRVRVLELLHGVDCCTHLNDALRAMADVASLVPAIGT